MVIRPRRRPTTSRTSLTVWRDAGAVPSATDDEGSIAALLAFDPGALLLAGNRRSSRRHAHRGMGRVAGRHVPARGRARPPAQRRRGRARGGGGGAPARVGLPAHHRARRRRARTRGGVLDEHRIHPASRTAPVRALMEHLAERLAQIPGVEVVTLGGSRAAGTARAHSDWDFGLYYRTTDRSRRRPRARLRRARCSRRGSGARSRTAGRGSKSTASASISCTATSRPSRQWTADAEAGTVPRLPGGRLRRGRADLQLRGRARDQPPPRGFAAASRLPSGAASACARCSGTGSRSGGLKFADAHARRDDAVACAGNLAVAALATAHARDVREASGT